MISYDGDKNVIGSGKFIGFTIPYIGISYESYLQSVFIDSVRFYFNQDDGDGSMKMASDSST